MCPHNHTNNAIHPDHTLKVAEGGRLFLPPPPFGYVKDSSPPVPAGKLWPPLALGKNLAPPPCSPVKEHLPHINNGGTIIRLN